MSPPFSLRFQFDKAAVRLIAIDEQDKKAKKAKKSKKGESGGKAAKPIEASPSTNGTGTANGQVSKRHAHAAPRVEEVEDE